MRSGRSCSGPRKGQGKGSRQDSGDLCLLGQWVKYIFLYRETHEATKSRRNKNGIVAYDDGKRKRPSRKLRRQLGSIRSERGEPCRAAYGVLQANPTDFY